MHRNEPFHPWEFREVEAHTIPPRTIYVDMLFLVFFDFCFAREEDDDAGPVSLANGEGSAPGYLTPPLGMMT